MTTTDQPESDLLQKLKSVKQVNPFACPVQRIVDSLDGETREVLVTLLRNDSNVSTRELHRVLKVDYKLSRESIAEHRSGACRCIKESK